MKSTLNKRKKEINIHMIVFWITSFLSLLFMVLLPIHGTGLYSMITDFVSIDQTKGDAQMVVFGWIILTLGIIVLWTLLAITEHAKLQCFGVFPLVHPVSKCVTLLYLPAWWWFAVTLALCFNKILLRHVRPYSDKNAQ